MTPEFKDAKLYTCSDSSYITHECWSEAINEYMEDSVEKDETLVQQCERIGDLEVMAYNPTQISPAWIASEVDDMMERFEERFNEFHGCDEHEADPWTKDTREWAKKVLVANLTKSLRSATTHACEQVGTHTFTEEECIEMVK